MALETPSDTPPMNSHQQNDDPCGSGKEERERTDVNMEDGEILEDGEIVDSGDDEMPSDAHHMFRGSQNPWAGVMEQMNNDPIEEVSRKKKKKKKRKRKKDKKSDSEDEKTEATTHTSPVKGFVEKSPSKTMSSSAEKKPRRHRKHRPKQVQSWLYADSDHSQQSDQEYMSDEDGHGFRDMHHEEQYGYDNTEHDMDNMEQHSSSHEGFGRGRREEHWERGKGRPDRGRGRGEFEKGRGTGRGRGSERGRGSGDRGRGTSRGRGAARSQQSKPPPEITKNLICKFYMDNACLKGANCTYSHDLNPTKKPEICKFYLQDSCARGDTCLFYHAQYPCKFFHMGQPCYSGDNCKFSHDPLTDETRPLLDKVLNSNKDFPTAPIKPGLLGDSPYDNKGPNIPSLFDIKVAPTQGFLKRKQVEFYGTPEDEIDMIAEKEEFRDTNEQRIPQNVEQRYSETDRQFPDGENKPKKPEPQMMDQPVQKQDEQPAESSLNVTLKLDGETSHDVKKPQVPAMPAKQRELFLRIQQKQQNDSATEDEAPKAQKTDDDNWYSSDEEDESKKNLSMILKTIRTNTSSSISTEPTNSAGSSVTSKPQLPNAIVSLLEVTGLVPSSTASSNPPNSERAVAPNNSLTVDIQAANDMPSAPSSPCDFRLVDITHSQDVKDPRIGRDRKNLRNLTFKVCKWILSEHTVNDPMTPIELTTPTELKSRVGFPQLTQPAVKPSDPRLQKLKESDQVSSINPPPIKSPPQNPRIRPSMPAALLRPPADFGTGTSPPHMPQIRPQKFSGPGGHLNKPEGMWLGSEQDPALIRPPPVFRDPRLKSEPGSSPPTPFSPPRQPFYPRAQNRLPSMGPPLRGMPPRGHPARMPFPGAPRPRFPPNAPVRHDMAPGNWRLPLAAGQHNPSNNEGPKTALNDPRLSRRNNPPVEQRLNPAGPQDPRAQSVAEPRGPVPPLDPRIHTPLSDPRQRSFDPRLSRQNIKLNSDLSDPRKRPIKDDNGETGPGFSIPKIPRMDTSTDPETSANSTLMVHRPVPNAHHNMPQMLGSFNTGHQPRMAHAPVPVSSEPSSGTWVAPDAAQPLQQSPMQPQPVAPLKDVFKTKDPTASPFC